jgi:hypothetical protein
MDSTLLITIISGIILFVQALLLFLGRKFGWTMYIKPIWLIVWFIIFVGGLYSLITGNKIIG